MKPDLSSPERIQETLTAAISRPSGQIELAVLIGCVLAAFAVDRWLNRPKASVAADTSDTYVPPSSPRRLVFPLTGLALVTFAWYVLRAYGIREGIIGVGFGLFVALAVIRAVVHILRLSFKASAWLANSERIISATVWIVLALYLLGILQDGIELLKAVTFRAGSSQVNLWQAVEGAAVMIVAVLAALWIAGWFESRLRHSPKLDHNLQVALSRLTRSLLVLVAVLAALALVGIDLTALSVFGGALGVGLGFGMQRIASNYVSGFIILLDRSIRIGNMITVDNDRGQVTNITTRYTVLRGLEGVEAIVPNELLVTNIVRNESYTDPKVRVALPFQVSYRTDLEQAMEVLVKAAQAQPRILTNPAPQAYLAAFADSGINLELGVWIADPQEGTLAVTSAINLAVWREFKRLGIEIPYPQREVRLLGDQAGQSPRA